MAKIQKRGKSGNAAKYVTRTQAVKRLQIKLAEFRRLCILKGIHPREPKKKIQGQNKTYYHVKDIKFLAHEPLLDAFRAISAHKKKVRKARALRNFDLAKQLLERTPEYKLDLIVKERYPTFHDALRDLDDALSMVNLFATLPSSEAREIPHGAINTARRLVLEWQAYCCRTHAIRKAFISVKGFYIQAEVHNEKLTWLVPHMTGQFLPTDVDFRVMLTFLEFYTTLLQFVFFRLYHDLGLRYPPVVDAKVERTSLELAAIMRNFVQPQAAAPQPTAISDAEMQQRASALPGEVLNLADDRSHPESTSTAQHAPAHNNGAMEHAESPAEAGAPTQPAGDPDAHAPEADQQEKQQHGSGALEDPSTGLFKRVVVWLSREVPREILMLLIRSSGGVACWDGDASPYQQDDLAITHAVVDRPTQGNQAAGRIFVQPQWVFDSINFRVLAPVEDYAPGKKPPPHVSPFLDYTQEEYVPAYAQRLLQLQEAAEAVRQRAEEGEAEGDVSAFVGGQLEADAPASSTAPGAESGLEAEELFQRDLAAELGSGAGLAKKKKRKATESKVENDDELDDSQKKALMSRKQRKMFEGLRKRELATAERVARLKAKRKQLEHQQ